MKKVLGEQVGQAGGQVGQAGSGQAGRTSRWEVRTARCRSSKWQVGQTGVGQESEGGAAVEKLAREKE